MDEIKKIKCPDCNEVFELEDYLEEGEIIYCPNCGVELELIEIEPPRVKILKEEDYNDEELEEEF